MSVVDMTCLLCGKTAHGARSGTAEIEITCAACGLYTITVGAVNALSQSPTKGSLMRAEVARCHAAGEAVPHVDMSLIDSATGPKTKT